MGEPTDFGRILRELREARDWSRRELAERSGVSEDYIVKIEDGTRRDPGFTKAQRLARALRQPLTVFAGERQPYVESVLGELRDSHYIRVVEEESREPISDEDWEWMAWLASAPPLEGVVTPYYLAGSLRLKRMDPARRRT